MALFYLMANDLQTKHEAKANLNNFGTVVAILFYWKWFA